MKKVLVLILAIILFPLRVCAEQINVAFTIDNNYLPPAMLAINSILKNNTSNSDYMFYIVENNLSFIDKLILKNFISKNNQKFEIIHYTNRKLQSSSTAYFNSSVTMSRVELPNLLPESVKKVLYLDADILVVGDLKELYDIDLTDEYAGMAYDAISRRRLYVDNCGFTYYKGSFNSGVILMNLEKWREDKISEKMISFVVENKDRFIREEGVSACVYKYPDQDLINRVLYGQIKPIDEKWNYISKFSKDAVIYHFIGSNKPWKIQNLAVKPTNFQKIDLYNEYWNNSSLRYLKQYYILVNMRDVYVNRCKVIFARYNIVY